LKRASEIIYSDQCLELKEAVQIVKRWGHNVVVFSSKTGLVKHFQIACWLDDRGIDYDGISVIPFAYITRPTGDKDLPFFGALVIRKEAASSDETTP